MWLTVEELKKSLESKGNYATSDDVTRRVLDRPFWRLGIWFHFLLFRVIASGCMIARRRAFGCSDWAIHAARSIRAVERAGGKIEIDVGDVGKFAGPAVIVANHMSMLETLILPALVLPFNDAVIVVKQALLDMPMFGTLMKSVDAIGVGRSDPRRDLKAMMEGGVRCLKSGKSLMIFPQSTRLPVFDPAKFNSIGVKIASRAQVPVIPVALKTDMLGIGKVIKDFGKVDRKKKVWFRAGEPLPPTLNKKEIHDKCVSFIVSNLREWGAEIVESDTAKGGDQNE